MTFITVLLEDVDFIKKEEASGVRYCCLKCNRTYKKRCNLNRHIYYECGKKKLFQCDKCNKCVTRKETLIVHMHTMHNIDAKTGVSLRWQVIARFHNHSSSTKCLYYVYHSAMLQSVEETLIFHMQTMHKTKTGAVLHWQVISKISQSLRFQILCGMQFWRVQYFWNNICLWKK